MKCLRGSCIMRAVFRRVWLRQCVRLVHAPASQGTYVGNSELRASRIREIRDLRGVKIRLVPSILYAVLFLLDIRETYCFGLSRSALNSRYPQHYRPHANRKLVWCRKITINDGMRSATACVKATDYSDCTPTEATGVMPFLRSSTPRRATNRGLGTKI